MKIHKTDNTRFSGVYRIPNSPKTFAEIEKFVIPTYEYIRHKEALMVVGKWPFKEAIDRIMENISKEQGSPISWLKMNANNHGVDFSPMHEEIISVISGEDLEKLAYHMQQRIERKTTVWEKIKNIFTPNQENFYDDKPEHLRLLFYALDKLEEENQVLDNKFAGEIKQVKTSQELLTKMMQEK